MRIHHLNCGTLCPLGHRWLLGRTTQEPNAPICCHCLLIEGRDGLILVDTGLGTADVAEPARLGGVFTKVLRPCLRMTETALFQVRDLGYDPRDVRHIILTHLDLDHAGGMSDFPWARVHVHQREWQRAHLPRWRDRLRYRPAQWAHQPLWVQHAETGERWMGLEGIRALPATGDEVLMIPLPGHSHGHCGVAARQGKGWLLHCGDAYFFHGELDEPAHCPLAIRFFESLVQAEAQQRLLNLHRLRALHMERPHEVTLVCAHDGRELADLQRRAAQQGCTWQQGWPGRDQDRAA